MTLPENTSDIFIPSVSIDCTIFGFDGQNLNVLILKLKGKELWSLPGGFVRREESLDQAASRILEERTSLNKIFLQQYHTFGSLDRDNTAVINWFHEMKLLPDAIMPFLNNRFISVGYYALVKQREADISSDMFSSEVRWGNVNDLPAMALDHGEMVTKALEALRYALNNQPIGLNLLPKKFTMTELQQLYESILGKSLDRRNFARKINRFGILKKLNERRSGVAHKSPQLYSFDRKKYLKALEAGFTSIW